MPQIKSAIKRVRTSSKAKEANISKKSAMRSAIKKFEVAAETGAKNTEELYRTASSYIDKAKSKGIIKANKAARDKSRLATKLSKK